MLVVAAMEKAPVRSSEILIDGIWETDSRLGVFVNSIDGTSWRSAFEKNESSPADVLILPKSDLPMVFNDKD